MERRSEGPENQPYVPFWKELPSEQRVTVLVRAKIPASADEQLSMEKTIVKGLTRHSQAAQRVLDYMQDTPDSFSNVDRKSILKMGDIGYLAVTLTPVHCDNLMESGLVETIIPANIKLDIIV